MPPCQLSSESLGAGSIIPSVTGPSRSPFFFPYIAMRRAGVLVTRHGTYVLVWTSTRRSRGQVPSRGREHIEFCYPTRRHTHGSCIGKERRNGPVQLQGSEMKRKGWYTHHDPLGWGSISALVSSERSHITAMTEWMHLATALYVRKKDLPCVLPESHWYE